MSTNSVIAMPEGDAWVGRYVHWSGDPTWMGPQLLAIVKRDGIAKAREVLVETEHSWSQIDAAYDPNNVENAEGAYVDIAGYGAAHDRNDTADEVRPQPDDHRWLYVLADDALWVGKVEERPDFYAVVRYTDPEPDWQTISYKECGKDYETCGHYAYVHFPEAAGTRLGTAQWLGREPLTVRDCTELSYKGRTYRIGGGSLERKFANDSEFTFLGYGTKWYGYLTDVETGRKRDDIAIYNAKTLKPYAGVTFHYPTISTGAPT